MTDQTNSDKSKTNQIQINNTILLHDWVFTTEHSDIDMNLIKNWQEKSVKNEPIKIIEMCFCVGECWFYHWFKILSNQQKVHQMKNVVSLLPSMGSQDVRTAAANLQLAWDFKTNIYWDRSNGCDQIGNRCAFHYLQKAENVIKILTSAQ